jgi:hypothetical protein
MSVQLNPKLEPLKTLFTSKPFRVAVNMRMLSQSLGVLEPAAALWTLKPDVPGVEASVPLRLGVPLVRKGFLAYIT